MFHLDYHQKLQYRVASITNSMRVAIICNEQQEFDKSEVKHKGSLFGSFLLAYNSIWDNGIDIKQWDAEGKNFNK